MQGQDMNIAHSSPRARLVVRHGKTTLLVIFYVAILFCLADGILDVVLSQGRLISSSFNKQAAKIRDGNGLVSGVVPAQNYYRFADMRVAEASTAIGATPLPISRPGFHIGQDGERLAPAVRSPVATGLLLGASQAFGLYDLDDETLAANLQRALPGIALRNFAVPGQKVRQSMATWRVLRDKRMRFDFVILVSGPMDLTECRSGPALEAREPGLALARLFGRAQSKRVGRDALHCAEPREVALQVDRLIYDLESALAYARRVGVPLAIVVPPTPFGNRSDHSNLKFGERFMGPLTWALRRRLEQQPIAGVYDLSGAFDGQPPYFIDLTGHMSATGQAVLARAIARRVGAGFFSPADKVAVASPAQKSK
jgi:hypothetical protein